MIPRARIHRQEAFDPHQHNNLLDWRGLGGDGGRAWVLQLKNSLFSWRPFWFSCLTANNLHQIFTAMLRELVESCQYPDRTFGYSLSTGHTRNVSMNYKVNKCSLNLLTAFPPNKTDQSFGGDQVLQWLYLRFGGVGRLGYSGLR